MNRRKTATWDRLVVGPGRFPWTIDLPLDVVYVAIGFAMYARVPNAGFSTVVVLWLCSLVIRRALTEITARTRFRNVLRLPPRKPDAPWSKY